MYDHLINQPNYFTTTYFWASTAIAIILAFFACFVFDRIWGDEEDDQEWP